MGYLRKHGKNGQRQNWVLTKTTLCPTRSQQDVDVGSNQWVCRTALLISVLFKFTNTLCKQTILRIKWIPGKNHSRLSLTTWAHLMLLCKWASMAEAINFWIPKTA